MIRHLAIAALLAACNESSPRTFDPSAAKGVFTDVVLAAPDGLSGLALDERGVIWAIPERDRQLVSITLSPASAEPIKPVLARFPLDGIADGLDTEGLAWLGDGHVAIALEGQDGPRAAIAFAERRGDRFVVTRTQSLEQLALGATVTKNHGAEAICGTTGDLVVAIEATGRFPDGGRFAPIVRIAGDAITVMRLRLSTTTGKISALECAGSGDGTHVWAIERHYGVSRIVKFVLPRDATSDTIELGLDVFRDLAPILRDSLNLEGLVRLADGRLVAVADNQGKSVAGPSRLLVFPANAGTH